MAASRYDCVIIGSGPGGATLGYALGRRGLNVLIVEQGDYLVPDRNVESVGVYKPHRRYPVVGGDTKYYGAALYRMRESDFLATQHEGGESPAWPITYSDLEPFYSEAEQLYRVHGSLAGDPTEPPHSTPYPFPPIPHQGIVADVVERIERQGVSVSYVPKAIDYGPGGRCVLCATCDAHYCQLDAKLDAEVAALRPALKHPNVELMVNTECLRILTTPDGKRVHGVALRRGGEDLTLLADSVAVCGGVFASPVLLRRSSNGAHPRGIGNSSGCLGRYMSSHTVGFVFPVISSSELPPLHTKTFAIHEYYNGSPGWPYPTGAIQSAGQVPLWKDLMAVWRPIVRPIVSRSLWVHCSVEALGSRDTGLHFDDSGSPRGRKLPKNVKACRKLRALTGVIFREAGYRVVVPPITQSWALVGSVRFGHDPATSVLDPWCRVHDISGLYVVDACFMPSAGAINPTLTIAAMALRVGKHISGAT